MTLSPSGVSFGNTLYKLKKKHVIKTSVKNIFVTLPHFLWSRKLGQSWISVCKHFRKMLFDCEKRVYRLLRLFIAVVATVQEYSAL